ncbi:MAG TPA: type II toxin-antitoxin system Phd/YefM family antitoxin [Isosphaeraceae bacterium]|jgi:prevent-host-death family protein|nr:type II toxin-antitoxin system Phd/YefM family antitoxin [Isosphaeraceae bacterium]
MIRLPASQARDDFAEVLNRVAYKGDRIVLHRRGKDVAAVISIEDLKLFERLIAEEENRIDLKAARKALKEPGSIAWDQVTRDLEMP